MLQIFGFFFQTRLYLVAKNWLILPKQKITISIEDADKGMLKKILNINPFRTPKISNLNFDKTTDFDYCFMFIVRNIFYLIL